MALVGHPPLRSFAAADYHGLHAYYLVDGEGRRQAFRYHWTSTMADERTVTAREAARGRRSSSSRRCASAWRGAGALGADLRAGPGRRSDRRPAARLAGVATRLHAGTLTLTGSTPTRTSSTAWSSTRPTFPAGIECSDDPLLAFRSAVYSASHAARTRETKPVSDLGGAGRDR